MGGETSTPSSAAEDRPRERDSRAEPRLPAVLQVLPSLGSGGVERGTVELARALVAAGWSSYVASAGGPLERELKRAGATHLKLPLHSKNPLRMRANASSLIALIRRLGIDIVHARSRAPAWSAWWAAQATGRHFVTTFHNAYDLSLPLKRYYNAIMARGERVIAISDFVAEHVAFAYGVGPQRLRTILRGVDFDQFSPHRVGAERIVALAREWRLPDGALIAMLPARLSRWKGGLDFIAAIAALGRVEVYGLLIGVEQRRGFRSELERAIERHRLGARFRIVDGCSDMPAAYMLADVVVSASTDPEGFGRVIVEAQAMGRPVVATDHGAARETILSGVTGWLVPPSGPAALTAAIDEALSLPPEARARIARAAMSHVAQSFPRGATCAKTIAVYEEVLFGESGGQRQR
jgi:glycosyltransferase involved in cell wall biosynthesis